LVARDSRYCPFPPLKYTFIPLSSQNFILIPLVETTNMINFDNYSLLLLLSHFSHVWLCDRIDGSPPGSPVPGILQARTLEWVAISFSNAWKCKVKVKSLSRIWLLLTSWTAAQQAPPSMGVSRREYWSGLPFPAPGDLPDPRIEPGSPAFHADSLPSELPGKPEHETSVKYLLALFSSPLQVQLLRKYFHFPRKKAHLWKVLSGSFAFSFHQVGHHPLSQLCSPYLTSEEKNICICVSVNCDYHYACPHWYQYDFVNENHTAISLDTLVHHCQPLPRHRFFLFLSFASHVFITHCIT